MSGMRRFNTTGTCFEDKHYMVNIDERVQQIKKMVDRGDYFCINRGRQYGKTTTLRFLKKALDGESYNERGEEQLAEYLDYYNLDRGYLLSFCFNKNKKPGLREITVQTSRGEKTLVEAVV